MLRSDEQHRDCQWTLVFTKKMQVYFLREALEEWNPDRTSEGDDLRTVLV